MYDLITMGSSTVDAFLSTDSEFIEIKTKTTDEELIAYPLGSKIMINELRYDIGGNGVNVAVGAKRLGLNVAYLGKVGMDANGEKIIERLAKEKVDYIGPRGENSGFSVILDSDIGKDRTILTYKGCNNKLKNEEIDYNKIQTKWLYITSLLQDSFETMKHVAGHAKHHGFKIAFNPSSSITRLGLDHIKELLEQTDFLILNESEAEDLVGKGTPYENLKKLQNLGIGIVVMTRGENGLIASDGEQTWTAKPTEGRKICETTGAGDACTSGFLSGLILGKDILTCIRIGMLNSESVLCHYGAHNKLLTMPEVEELLHQDSRDLQSKV